MVVGLFAYKYNFWFTATHIPGRLNVAADALSRNNMSIFSSRGSSGRLSADHSSSNTDITVIARHYMDMKELNQAVQRYFTAA